MGFPVPPGDNVPAWLVNATELGDLFERLTRALQRSPSFSGATNPSLLGVDRASVRDSIARVADAAESAHVELRQAFAEFKAHSIDRAHQQRLTSLANELTTLWSVRATMTLGTRRERARAVAWIGPLNEAGHVLQRRRTVYIQVTSPPIRKAQRHETVVPMLERELQHREIVPGGGSYAAKLIGWVEVSGGNA